MSKVDDIYLDKKFGKLTVIRRVENDKHRNRQFLCLCDCGVEKNIRARDLKNEKIISCGCNKIKHGMSNHRMHNIWKDMKYRCNNENCHHYDRYGGRGIKVCDEWSGDNGFINFYNWSIDNGYSDDLTIDRIDNDDDYNPINCRWITMLEQSKNKSNNILITINNKTQTLSDWAKEHNLDKETVRGRFLCGDEGMDLLRKPYEKKENV